MISAGVRLRTNPIFPVRQKSQSIAQPTWLEMQKVCRGVSGMKTDSMRLPSASWNRNFRVPSVERASCTSCGVEITNSCGNCSRSSTGRSDINAKSVTPLR